MRLILADGELRRLINHAIACTGTERNLERAVRIPKSSINRYKRETALITDLRFGRLLKLIGASKDQFKIVRKVPDSWGQSKGGKSCYASKVKTGTWQQNLEKMRRNSYKISQWHAHMRETEPEKYYSTQYSNFKHIGGYKCVSMRGERVRNELEKAIADLIHRLGLNYEYEPFVKGQQGCYFPDFRIGKVIVECTMWRGSEKADKLQKKIKDLERCGYSVIVYVPPKLRGYYKVLESNMVSSTQELKDKLCPDSSAIS